MLFLALVVIAIGTVTLAEPIVYGTSLNNIQPAPFTVYVDIVNKVPNPKLSGKFLTYTDVCTGVIISKKAVLTAAHCIPDEGHVDITIFAGSAKLADFLRAQAVKMNKPVIHPGYHKNKLMDLAIIKLKKELIPVKGKVEIAEFGDIVPGAHTTAYGWGTMENGEKTDILKKAVLKIVPKKKCNPYFDKEFNILCAWADNRETTPCVGDSGGPLVLNGKVIGILSQVKAKTTVYDGKKKHYFCHADRPSIYVRVKKYLSWIQANK